MAQELGLSGPDYGRFKDLLRIKAVLEGFNLEDEAALAKAYQDFVRTPPAWRK